MYKFSYVNNVSGKAQVVDKTLFEEVINSAMVKITCDRIATLMEHKEGNDENQVTEQVGKLKRGLPAFCWHAWFENGVRKNDCAYPSYLIMIDVDHEEEPLVLWETIQERAKELGLLAAHVTPSTKGLRLVLPMVVDMTMEEAQRYYVDVLGLKNVDECTKDLARLSFCVPVDYWQYVDEERLFGGKLVNEGVMAIQKVEDEDAELKEVVPQQEVRNEYNEEYDGLPYDLIVECLCEQLGGVPAHGSRNNFIFTMAAYLRYVCDDDPKWIAKVLPNYGENEQKWRSTIESACKRAQYRDMPMLVRRALVCAREKMQIATGKVLENGELLPPAMPQRLPKLIKHLTKNVPEVCRPAVAHAVFPALATHLKGVKFLLIDGTEKEATFMCVTMAKQSSGKASINKPIEYIIADIVDRDELNRKREQEWKDSLATKGSNKEKPKRPDDLCVQVLVSDMTNAAFVQRMKDANGRYLYTNIEELDLLKQLQTNGTKDIGKIICLCFDNGKYGQERVGLQSVMARVDLRWNWNASSTINKGINFFNGRLVDGTLSRLNFCTIVQDKTKPFKYGRYDEKYAEVLKPYITNLNLANGIIECPQALDLAQKMLDECQQECALCDDDVYQDLSYRAITIAYLKSMVLYIANGMKWSKDIATFAEWSLKYDLWCKNHFFGTKLQEEKDKERVKMRPGRRNMLDMLADTFTLKDAGKVRHQQGLEENPKQMISTWLFRGYIEYDEVRQVYCKTDFYLERISKKVG